MTGKSGNFVFFQNTKIAFSNDVANSFGWKGRVLKLWPLEVAKKNNIFFLCVLWGTDIF